MTSHTRTVVRLYMEKMVNAEFREPDPQINLVWETLLY